MYLDADNVGKWSIAFADLRYRNRTLVRAVLAYEGSTAAVPSASFVPAALRSAPLLTYAQMQSAKPRGSLFTAPTRTYDIRLTMGMMMNYIWMINGQAFPRADPIVVSNMDQVRFKAINQTMMYHPMHLHGHFMRVHGSLGGTRAPLIKDTVLVPPGNMMRPGLLDVDWLADNPGNWPYHCHQIYHMAAGMMRLVEYVGRDGDLDGLADGKDYSPASAYPVTWTDGGAGAFRVGSRVRMHAQWQPGEWVLWFVGAPLSKTIGLGNLGDMRISLYIPLGQSQVASNNLSSTQLSLPNDPSLKGVRAGLQAIVTHKKLAPGLRLSTMTYLTIR